jgi:hypothetical protein
VMKRDLDQSTTSICWNVCQIQVEGR